jgi:hypothetical protein
MVAGGAGGGSCAASGDPLVEGAVSSVLVLVVMADVVGDDLSTTVTAPVSSTAIPSPLSEAEPPRYVKYSASEPSGSSFTTKPSKRCDDPFSTRGRTVRTDFKARIEPPPPQWAVDGPVSLESLERS